MRAACRALTKRHLALRARDSCGKFGSNLEDLYQVEVTPEPDQRGHRQGDGGSHRLAAAAAGGLLRRCCLMSPGEDPGRGGRGNEAIDVALGVTRTGGKEMLGPGSNRPRGRASGTACSRSSRAGESRTPDRVDRRARGVSGGDHRGVSPDAVHTCVVHLVRRSLAYVGYRERKEVAEALRRSTAPRPAPRRRRPWPRFRPVLGPPVSADCGALGAGLAARHRRLCVSPGDPAGLSTTNAMEDVHGHCGSV